LKGDEGVQNLGGWPKMAIFARGVITCRFRILDSSVPMVQPAKDQMRNNVSGPLDWARVGRVLPERNVSSHVIIIGGIFRKNSSKVLCVEHNQMISALASDRPDQAFSIVSADAGTGRVQYSIAFSPWLKRNLRTFQFIDDDPRAGGERFALRTDMAAGNRATSQGRLRCHCGTCASASGGTRQAA